jgi:hypothetical protein
MAPNLPSGLTNVSGLPTGLTGAEKAGSWQNIKAQPSLLDQMQKIVDLQNDRHWIQAGVYTHVANQAGVDPNNWQAFQQAAQVGSLLDQIAGGGMPQGGGQQTRDQFDMGLNAPDGGSLGNVAPTFGENGQTAWGNALEKGLQTMLDPTGTGFNVTKAFMPPPISLVMALASLVENGGLGSNVGNLGQDTGQGVPFGIGPPVSGADDVASAIAMGLNAAGNAVGVGDGGLGPGGGAPGTGVGPGQGAMGGVGPGM